MHYFAVDAGCQFCLFTTVEQLWTDEHWSDRRKFIECLGVEKLAAVLCWKLEKATAEIISCCVSQDTRLRFLYTDISAFSGRGKDEFTLWGELLVIFFLLKLEKTLSVVYLPIWKIRCTIAAHLNVLFGRCQSSSWLCPQWWVHGNIELSIQSALK